MNRPVSVMNGCGPTKILLRNNKFSPIIGDGGVICYTSDGADRRLVVIAFLVV